MADDTLSFAILRAVSVGMMSAPDIRVFCRSALQRDTIGPIGEVLDELESRRFIVGTAEGYVLRIEGLHALEDYDRPRKS